MFIPTNCSVLGCVSTLNIFVFFLANDIDVFPFYVYFYFLSTWKYKV